MDNKDKTGKGWIEGAVLATSASFTWISTDTEELAVAAASTFGKVRPNDSVRAYLIGADHEEIYLASKSLTEPIKTRDSLASMYEHKEIVQGTVSRIIKGGFNVDIGANAFLPFSRSGARNQGEMERLVGRQILCTIVEFEGGGDNIVVDRRSLLDEAESLTQSWRLDELRVGERVSGTVRTLTDFGAFIDIGGIDGLVHVSDISSSPVTRPSDVLSLGQEVDAIIERIDPKRGRVGLSLKALQSDPWAGVAEKYFVGDKVTGTVTTVTDFGYFVELEPGVEGLAHKASAQGEILPRGIKSEFTIINVNLEERRIGLAVDSPTCDPWKDIETRYPVGAIVAAKVTTITQFGAFVDLGTGIEGMIHVSDLSDIWIKHPKDVLKPGMEIHARVLVADSQRRRLHLGLKQLPRKTEMIAAPVAPQVPEAMNTDAKHSDFALYSKSVFVNWPGTSDRRAPLNAILFAIIDAGFLPRLANEHAPLLKAIRESQYGIHEISRQIEVGLFLGCQEFGGDIHRQKQSLLLHASEGAKLLDRNVVVYSNDPVKALKCVSSWLEDVTGTRALGRTEPWKRYECFLEDLPGMNNSMGVSLETVSVDEYLRLVRDWLRLAGSADPQKPPLKPTGG